MYKTHSKRSGMYTYPRVNQKIKIKTAMSPHKLKLTLCSLYGALLKNSSLRKVFIQY